MISCPYLILCDSHRCSNVCPPHWLITADPLRRILKSTDSCPNWMASIWLWACHRKPTIIIIWPVYSICKVFNTVHCTIIQHHSVCRIFWVRLRSRIVNWNWQTHRRLTGLFIWSKFFAHYYILIIFFFIFSNSILQITSIFFFFCSRVCQRIIFSFSLLQIEFQRQQREFARCIGQLKYVKSIRNGSTVPQSHCAGLLRTDGQFVVGRTLHRHAKLEWLVWITG